MPIVEGRAEQRPTAPSTQEGQRSRVVSTLNRLVGRRQEPSRQEVLDSLPKFWPIMTILITLVEVGMLVAVMVAFGLAPIDIRPTSLSETIVGFDNISEYETRQVVPNFFIGPSSSSLIHSGAMYTPVRFALKSICVYLVLRFCTVSWSNFDDFKYFQSVSS